LADERPELPRDRELGRPQHPTSAAGEAGDPVPRTPRMPGPDGAPERHSSRVAHALGADDDLPLDPDLDVETGGEAAPAPRGVRRPSSRGRGPAVAATLGAVFCGGFLGTVGRDLVERAWPTQTGHFPTATFVINTSGAFLLGLLLTVLIERVPLRSGWLGPRPAVAARIRAFMGAGMLGGWTTYSTLAVEAVALARGGKLALAAGYLAISLVCGISGTAAGIGLGRSRALDAVSQREAPQSSKR